MKIYKILKTLVGGCTVALLAVCVLAVSPSFAWEPPQIEKPKNFPNYPERPVDYIIPWGVGGGADICGRAFAEVVKKYYGIDLVITNMSGATGLKAQEYVLRQPTDGYTLMALLYDGYLNYLTGQTKRPPETFYYFARLQSQASCIFIRKDFELQTWDDLLAHSKKNPYKLRIASSGKGSLEELTIAMLSHASGLQVTPVAFNEASQRFAAFAGGHTELLFTQHSSIKALIDDGAKGLILISDARMPDFPDTPTTVEKGYDVTLAQNRGLAFAANTPKEIIEYWEKITEAVAQSPEYIAFLKRTASSPESVVVGEAANKLYMEGEYRTVERALKQQ